MSGTLKMVDVGDKRATARRALTRGSLRMGLPAFKLLQAGRLPKGDALRVGEIAGLWPPELLDAIPLCHPPLGKVALGSSSMRLPASAFCESSLRQDRRRDGGPLQHQRRAFVYDLVGRSRRLISRTSARGRKAARAEWTIESSPPGRREEADRSGQQAVITISDRVAAPKTHRPFAHEGLVWAEPRARVVSDDAPLITAAVRRAARRADVVVLTGGTGLSPRDVTPETVAALCDRLVPGVGEALRAAGQASTPRSVLSRSLAGQLGRCLIVCLPGSPGGVRDGLKVLEGLLPHAVHIAQGGDH